MIKIKGMYYPIIKSEYSIVFKANCVTISWYLIVLNFTGGYMMNHFEKKSKIIEDAMKGRVVIIDPENEYKELAKMFGGKVITINPTDCGVINPFLIATEHAQTIDEKEAELRKLLDISDYGAEYARQRLSDMSFLDDVPEWKERATVILKEYAKI